MLAAAAILALWLASSVGAGQIVRYVAYHVAFVLGPGLVAYALLAPERRPLLRWLAIGWALGYVLEIGAFAATAAIGARELFLGYPVLVLGVGLLVARRRRSSREPEAIVRERGASIWYWAAALAFCLVLTYVAAGYVAKAPLPWRVPSVTYYSDLPFHISLAAEAKNHWPITYPGISGVTQPYQTFIYMDLAASSQVTGLPLPLIVMRLYFVPLLAALALQLVLVGRIVTRRAWGGALALALVLLVGEVDPDPSVAAPFGSSFLLDLYFSPTFLLGLVFFVPVLALLLETWRDGSEERLPRHHLIILSLLVVGCSGAKGTILPLVGVGVGVVVASRLLGERRWSRDALTVLGVIGGVFLISYFVLYRARSTGSSVDPLDTLLEMPVMSAVHSVVPDRIVPAAGFWLLFLPVALVGLFGPAWVGIAAALRSGARRNLARILLLALSVTGVAILLLLDIPGDAQLYFVWYAFVAGSILSAWGIALWVQRRTHRSRALAIGAASLIALGALDAPLDVFPPLVKRWQAHEPLYDTDGRDGRIGMTAGLYRALSWIRDETDESAVIAVNNHFGDTARQDPRYFYYSAFAERRVFLESWAYTARAYEVGYERVAALEVNPFEARLRLNTAAFEGEPTAVRALARRGVDYLVVDRVHGAAADLRGFARVVFRNDDALVYAL